MEEEFSRCISGRYAIKPNKENRTKCISAMWNINSLVQDFTRRAQIMFWTGAHRVAITDSLAFQNVSTANARSAFYAHFMLGQNKAVLDSIFNHNRIDFRSRIASFSRNMKWVQKADSCERFFFLSFFFFFLVCFIILKIVLLL